jgi:hypothetical protein
VRDPLVDRRITLDADVAADVADAETVITRRDVDGCTIGEYDIAA